VEAESLAMQLSSRVLRAVRPSPTVRMAVRPMSSMPQSGTWIDKELGYDTYAACLTAS
jgi:hypothetical protein